MSSAVLRAPFERRTWRELGYFVVTLLPAVPAFALALIGLVAVPLSIVGVGLPFLALVLMAARLMPRYFRRPARAILGWDWASPPPLAGGPLGRMRTVLKDRTGWRALLYSFIRFLLTFIVVYLSVVCIGAGIGAVTAPLWWFASPTGLGLVSDDGWARTWLLALQGVGGLLVFPWLLRAVTAIDRVLIFALLAPDADSERIAALEAGRATLAADSAATLRRIERDLHDGTQARLVSVGMMLSRLEGRVRDHETREMVTTAQQVVTEGLDELREIIRGMHPPALDDGLETALATLASRSQVSTAFTSRLVERPPDAAANTIYFSAAELITNVARHAHAARAELRLEQTPTAYVVAVHDDGRGGARLSTDGSGLSGLRRRAEALDGTLEVDSPPGGPTVVTMALPRRPREATT